MAKSTTYEPTFICHLCQDTGYQVFERKMHGQVYSFAKKCLDGQCRYWIKVRQDFALSKVEKLKAQQEALGADEEEV